LTTNPQLQKYQFIARELATGYFLADQRLALLQPLLNDEDLYRKWDRSHGSGGVSTIRMTLYMSVLADMKALMFDVDKRAASLANVITALKETAFIATVKQNFCEPPDIVYVGDNDDPELISGFRKHDRESHIEEATARFDRELPRTIKAFDDLKSTDLAGRVVTARDKMISHREIRTVDNERGLYEPEDFGLLWSDAEEIVGQSREVVFDTIYLLINETYHLEGFLEAHTEAADSFWSIPRNAPL
jgi:hypothetical protein